MIVNKEAFLAVADVIEYADRFDIGPYITDPSNPRVAPSPARLWEDCGTIGCVGGWTAAWAELDGPNVWTAISNELGIDAAQGDRLFFRWYESVWYPLAEEYGWTTDAEGIEPRSQITAAQAADVLRRIANGEVKL